MSWLQSSTSSPHNQTQKQFESALRAEEAALIHPILFPSYSTHRLTLSPIYRLIYLSTIFSTTSFGLGALQGGKQAALRFRAENAHRLPRSEKGWYFYHKTKNYHVMLGGIKQGLTMVGRVGSLAAVFFGMETGVDEVRAAWSKEGVSGLEELGVNFLEFFGWRSTGDKLQKQRKEREFVPYDRSAIINDEPLPEHVYESTDLADEDGVIRGRDFMSTTIAGAVAGWSYSVWQRHSMNNVIKGTRMGLLAGLGLGLAQDTLMVLKGNKLGYLEVSKRWLGLSTKERDR